MAGTRQRRTPGPLPHLTLGTCLLACGLACFLAAAVWQGTWHGIALVPAGLLAALGSLRVP